LSPSWRIMSSQPSSARSILILSSRLRLGLTG
jgi:hypothetical protein